MTDNKNFIWCKNCTDRWYMLLVYDNNSVIGYKCPNCGNITEVKKPKKLTQSQTQPKGEKE